MDTLWFEVAVISTIFALGHILLGHFVERTPKWQKVAKLAANGKLRGYVQDRLAGMIAALDGARLQGPKARWSGRRHGRRQDRVATTP